MLETVDRAENIGFQPFGITSTLLIERDDDMYGAGGVSCADLPMDMSLNIAIDMENREIS